VFITLYTRRTTRKGGTKTRSALEMLNTPIAVLVAGTIVVAVLGFLYFGYYLPRTTTPSAAPRTEQRVGPSTTIERTRPTKNIEETTSLTTASPTGSSPTATATGSP
jgi:hypothetical protein